jgi:transposase
MKVEDLRKENVKEKRSKEIVEERFANYKSQVANQIDASVIDKPSSSNIKSYSVSTSKI